MRLKAKVLVSVAVLVFGFLAPVPYAPAQAVNLAQALPDVADLAEKLLPSVVEISVQSKSADAPTQSAPTDQNPFKDFFDEFLKRKQQQGNKD